MGELFEGLGQEEIILRAGQEVMLGECRRASKKTKRFILKATCGAGKTVLASYFIRNAVKKGIKCLFVVDRIVLAEQTSKVFNKYGITHGIIQADNPNYYPDRMVQIGSVQTLTRREQEEYGLIIVDECHCHYEGHTKLLDYNKDSFIIGLSSTPYGKELGKYYDFFIEPVTVKEMIKHGELVPFDIYAPPIADLSKLKIRAGEYTEESLSNAYDQVDIVGDVVGEWKKLATNKKTIVFGVNVAHIKHIAKTFNKSGISACQINAYQSEKERKEAVDGFKEGDTKVLCSVEVATKGFDCPEVEVVCLAVATKSHIKWEQTTGRGFRLFKGKKRCLILDFGGNAERLGFPDDYELLELDDGKKYKSKAKKKERPEQLPKKCPSCDFIKLPGIRKCPACGFLPDFIEDVDTSEAELKKVQRKTNRVYTKEEKQSFFNQLNQYCRDKGWSSGAASHKYREKFGVWPNAMSKYNYEPIGDEVRKFIQYCNIKYAKGKNK